MNTTDRPTTLNVDCAHKIANHRHGTHACYVLDRCRCDECRGARTRYERIRLRSHGEFPVNPPLMVDAAPARRHVQALMSQGMGLKRIAQVTGLPHGGLSKLVYGTNLRPPSMRIRRATHEALIVLQLDVADGAKVDKTEAEAIVAELVARGWTKVDIGRRIGAEHYHSLQIGKGPQIQAGTLRALRPLLDEDVPTRVHSPTGRRYRPDTRHTWRTIRPSTPGVPEDWTVGSPRWLNVMRAGLREAVELARERDRKALVPGVYS